MSQALRTDNVDQELRVVGTRPVRPDGVDKVTGRAMFGADYSLPGMLVGRVLRSPHAHAIIKSIDTSKAEALPGVAAIITADDCSDNYGVLPIAMNEWALAKERVRYRGEPVAAMVRACT